MLPRGEREGGNGAANSTEQAGGVGRGCDGEIRALLTAYVEQGERTFPQAELEPLQSIWELGRLPTDILQV